LKVVRLNSKPHSNEAVALGLLSHNRIKKPKSLYKKDFVPSFLAYMGYLREQLREVPHISKE